MVVKTQKNLHRDLKRLKLYIPALYFAMQDKRVPWPVKAFGFAIVAYALSPIDLIPDFIPVLGYLDDVIILPAAIYALIKMIPRQALREGFRKAKSIKPGSAAGIIAGVAIGLVWAAVVVLVGVVIWGIVRGSK